MHRLPLAGCLALVIASLTIGCASKPIERDNAEIVMFGPTRMRLHPIFTQVKDWNNDNVPDGIEAELEFGDQFGDPTKAAGKVMFELYSYHRGSPDPRGERIFNPWVGSLLSLQQQYEHWNRTSRTYSFQLSTPTAISFKRTYVLNAMFEHSDGRRFFSQVILKGTEDTGIDTKNVMTPPPPPTTAPSVPTNP